MRILLAALAGAVAMFLWTAVAHMATPLGEIGFQQMPNEQPMLRQMSQSVGDTSGFYIFPWTSPDDPDRMATMQKLEKIHPSGMLLYRGVSHGMGSDMTPMLIKEFLKQFVQCLIWAWIASMLALSFGMRASAVVAMSVTGAIATNVSYWNWYGFPLDYTMAQITIEIVSGIVAGLAISAVLGRRTT